MTGETYAILMHGHLPERLFPDMEAAKQYVEDHDRISWEQVSVVWPIRVHDTSDPSDNLK